MKYHYLSIIITLLLLTGCNKDQQRWFKEPLAFAGGDQTTKVGQYVLFDASRSVPSRRDEIIFYEWTQHESNPAQVFLMSDKHFKTLPVGFAKEGIYKFNLRVRDNYEFSQPNEFVIRVEPRDNVIFEDPNLEILVRYSLQKPAGELNEIDLLSIDSLNFAPKIQTDDVQSLNGIERCSNLKLINMTLHKLTDLTPLTGLTQLLRLDIDQNRIIEDISPLCGLVQLQHLKIGRNNISDISPLKNLTQLRYLHIKNNNDISDISPLSDMKEMEELWMGFNAIEDISPISGMTNLKLLWSPRCNITDISAVSNLKNLHTIKFDYNPIGDISTLKELSKLELLYLADCEITDISALEYPENLSMIRLYKNNISDILPLVKNRGLGPGDFISLNGNPLNEKSKTDYIPDLRSRGVNVSF